MPLYEYVCDGCGKKFSELLTLAEHDRRKVPCPKCGARGKVRQIIEPFTAVTSKKS